MPAACLLALASSILARNDSPMATVMVKTLNDTATKLCAGQLAGLDFEQRTELSVAHYTAMAMGKTGALLGCACALGGVATSASTAKVELLHRYGHHLGRRSSGRHFTSLPRSPATPPARHYGYFFDDNGALSRALLSAAMARGRRVRQSLQ